MDYDSKSETPFAWWLTYEETDELPLVTLAQRMFSITPSEAGCERNFSILKWFYGDLRTCLNINKVELMSMMHTYWMTNIKKEMSLYGKNITDDDLRNFTQNSTVIYESDNIPEGSEADFNFESISTIALNITSIANLNHEIFSNNSQINVNREENLVNNVDNIDYNVGDLVTHFLTENE
jgi:hypothetical protein